MTNFTKKAIKESFLSLISEKPLSEITVKSIAERCGINRNTFYYHYDDIPTLIKEMITDEFNTIIESYPSVESVEQGLLAVLSFATKNKVSIVHIYKSVNRNIFEDYLWQVADSIVGAYAKVILKGRKISKKNKEVIITFLRAVAVGFVLDWMNTGMKENVEKDIHKICEFAKGTINRILENAEK